MVIELVPRLKQAFPHALVIGLHGHSDEKMDYGDQPEEMLKKAIALSSANAMTFETAHVIESDYKYLLPRCHVEKIK